MRMHIYENEEYDRRLRLVLLVYEVIEHMETPPEGTTDEETLLFLSRAFRDKATVLAKLELPPPKWCGGKPLMMYSTPDIGTSGSRRAH
jgi:hypothetical protein